MDPSVVEKWNNYFNKNYIEKRHEETTRPGETENPFNRFSNYNLQAGEGKEAHKADRHDRDV